MVKRKDMQYWLVFCVAALWTWNVLLSDASAIRFWTNTSLQPTVFHYGAFLLTNAVELPYESVTGLRTLWQWAMRLGGVPEMLVDPIDVAIVGGLIAVTSWLIAHWSSAMTATGAVMSLGIAGAVQFFLRAHTWWHWILNPLTLGVLFIAWWILAGVLVGASLHGLRGEHVLLWIGGCSAVQLWWSRETLAFRTDAIAATCLVGGLLGLFGGNLRAFALP